jgi:hypothetical protein
VKIITALDQCVIVSQSCILPLSQPATIIMCQASKSDSTVNTTKSLLNKKRSVRWNEQVNVKHIPSHRDYCELVKACLYMSRYELWVSRYCSMVELTLDGPDWRQALEEDCMPVNRYTGERIHPAHLALNLPPVAGPQRQERKSQASQPLPPENANHCLQELCAILG